ncbi:delta(3,5)-Delta(2,4)-dienoyl-CoA isomerase [Luminiphilus syltensis NOR5-1B]|uniref:Delta(3,5)-Delta(2,4)-dienoyl-CoA isomerase n=1 Tax=Luminiphilus syltensis NOR5-1B TaxID=565045 RepID=B8KXT1_9GAMM|nr:crotonase/enoyl-CoA hydratase family protein [Luminiphilus syltensis]EED36582.1 delta(3,5)-Delta(2,4)-dienoyl-CoA isomerase [Luminiphilus syltensis NOR5-1B]
MVSVPSLATLELTLEGRVLEVALNRPDKINALNALMWQELQTAFEWADQASAARVVILRGEGRHFCAGIDLAMLAGMPGSSEDPARRAETFHQNVRAMHENLMSIERCRKPVLAAIHGYCLGGAVDLISYADMRYGAASAILSIREIDIGMVADVGTLQRLPKLIPEGIVRELAFTGRNMEADEAASVGLFNAVFEDEAQLLDGVRNIAATIAEKSPLAVRGTKEILNFTRDHSVEDGLRYVAAWNAGMLSEQDLKEGLTAQAEKRAPKFSD